MPTTGLGTGRSLCQLFAVQRLRLLDQVMTGVGVGPFERVENLFRGVGLQLVGRVAVRVNQALEEFGWAHHGQFTAYSRLPAMSRIAATAIAANMLSSRTFHFRSSAFQTSAASIDSIAALSVWSSGCSR